MIRLTALALGLATLAVAAPSPKPKATPKPKAAKADKPAAAPAPTAETSWAQWRGPLGTGEAPLSRPPLEWAEGRNVRFKVPLPGKGKGAPIVWGDQIFLMAAIPKGDAGELDFNVLAYSRTDGKLLWERTVRSEKPHEGTHQDGTYASASPITDGRRLYAFFGSRGLYALDLQGQVLWHKDLGRMQTRREFGEGASPVLRDGTLLVNWDHEGEDFVVALDAETGQERWRQKRDEPTTWATPLLVEHAGRVQAIVPGTKSVRSYDLATGDTVWQTAGLTENVIPTPVTAGGMVYVMSGFRGAALRAFKLEHAKGEFSAGPALAFSYDKDTPYVPSPLLYRGGLYFLKSNSGVLTRLDATTGQVAFTERLDVPNVYASPVGADGRVYVVGRDGRTLVLEAGPTLKVLASNDLDDAFDASPALVGDDLFLRGNKSLYRLSSAAH